MEHACYKCGGSVEDGVPFCPHCSAPQIRVAGLAEKEPEKEPVTPPLTPGTPGEIQPPARPVPLSSEEWQRPPVVTPVSPTRIEWSKAVPGAILGGVLVALLSGVLPFPVFFVFLWMLAGGWIAALLYKRRARVAITPGMGARVGAAAGVIGFVLFAILTLIDFLVLGAGKLRAALIESIQQAAARNPDPRAQELLHRLTSPEGLAVLVSLSLAMFLVAFIVLSSAGGALFAYLRGQGGRRYTR